MDRLYGVSRDVDDQADALADSRGQGRAVDSHPGHGAQTEDEDGVQDDVGYTAAEDACHGHGHTPHRLIDFLKGHPQGDDHGKTKRDPGVPDSQRDDFRVAGEHAQKTGHDADADDGQHNVVEGVENQAGCGGSIGFFLFPGAQIEGDDRVDADGKSDGDRVNQVLYRKQKGQGGHGALADFCHKKTVYDVVERGHHHGKNHGK